MPVAPTETKIKHGSGPISIKNMVRIVYTGKTTRSVPLFVCNGSRTQFSSVVFSFIT